MQRWRALQLFQLCWSWKPVDWIGLFFLRVHSIRYRFSWLACLKEIFWRTCFVELFFAVWIFRPGRIVVLLIISSGFFTVLDPAAIQFPDWICWIRAAPSSGILPILVWIFQTRVGEVTVRLDNIDIVFCLNHVDCKLRQRSKRRMTLDAPENEFSLLVSLRDPDILTTNQFGQILGRVISQDLWRMSTVSHVNCQFEQISKRHTTTASLVGVQLLLISWDGQ